MIKFILVSIIVLGFILRFVGLNSSPPGFNADEAALGYNAFSILKTGKDEWGEAFPLIFKSFGDYKPGLYVYLTIPFVAVFGLTEFAVRLPSIFLGTLSILLMYFLAKEIFKRESVGLSTAFLLSISPWAIHFSRGAWEANIATFFMVLGTLFFVKGLTNFRFFYTSVLSFVFSIYAYQSTRLIVPLFGVLLFIGYFKKIGNKRTIPIGIFGVVLLLPLIFASLNNKGLARFQGVSIFGDKGPISRIEKERGYHQNPNGLVAKITHNKFYEYSTYFLDNYFDHFSPSFLFTQGDPLKRNKVPETGQLYLFEILTLLTGILFLIRNKIPNSQILFFWVLVGPVAAALTYQSPHALRALNMVIPLTIISGLGLSQIFEQLQKLRFKKIIQGIALLIVFYFFMDYLHQYYVHLPKQYSLEWEYGFSEVVPYAFQNYNDYEKITVTDRYDQPYILFLFYSKYDPLKYQQTKKTEGDNNFGFITVKAFDKFEFRKIGEIETRDVEGKMFIASEEMIDPNKKIIKRINFPNGRPAFRVIGEP